MALFVLLPIVAFGLLSMVGQTWLRTQGVPQVNSEGVSITGGVSFREGVRNQASALCKDSNPEFWLLPLL